MQHARVVAGLPNGAIVAKMQSKCQMAWNLAQMNPLTFPRASLWYWHFCYQAYSWSCRMNPDEFSDSWLFKAQTWSPPFHLSSEICPNLHRCTDIYGAQLWGISKFSLHLHERALVFTVWDVSLWNQLISADLQLFCWVTQKHYSSIAAKHLMITWDIFMLSFMVAISWKLFMFT